MFMFAEDDPVIGKEAIGYEECYKNPYVLLATTKSGGHTGYYESVINPEPWF